MKLALLLVVVFVVGAYALCDSTQDGEQALTRAFKFVASGKMCDGFYPGLEAADGGCSNCCKNWLSCMNFNGTAGVCQEISQGKTNCTTVEECGPTGMTCMKEKVTDLYGVCLFSGMLANGDQCSYDAQCMSGVCGPAPVTTTPAPAGLRSGVLTSRSLYGYQREAATGVCTPEPKTEGETCVPGPAAQCAAGLWCNPYTSKCTARLAKNANCTEGAGVATPNYVCAAGTGCLKTGDSEGSYQCIAYYSQNNKKDVCSMQNWWNCDYGYYCSTPNSTFPGTCKQVNMNSAIGNNCFYLPWTDKDQGECPWGGACDCFTTDTVPTKKSGGECVRMFNTNCEDQLDSYVSCIKKANCPHDPIPLIGYGPQGSIVDDEAYYTTSPFAGTIIVGSCAFTNCLSAHGSLLRCQNSGISSSSSPARTPSTFPNNEYSSSSSGLAGWEIGLIIVGIAVAVIIIVVVVVAVVRRKKNAPGYDTLS